LLLQIMFILDRIREAVFVGGGVCVWCLFSFIACLYCKWGAPVWFWIQRLPFPKFPSGRCWSSTLSLAVTVSFHMLFN
jgi:hypothetical protein